MAIFPDVRHTQMWSQDNNQIQQPFVVSTIPAPAEDQLVAKSRGWKLYKSEQEDSIILDLFHVNSFCSHKAMRIYDTLLCPNCGKHAPKKIVVTGVMIDPNFIQNTPDMNDFNHANEPVNWPLPQPKPPNYGSGTSTNYIIITTSSDTTTSHKITVDPNV